MAVSEEDAAMPKLRFARAAVDAAEERKIRRLAASRHAPGDWILRAKMIARSWDGLTRSSPLPPKRPHRHPERYYHTGHHRCRSAARDTRRGDGPGEITRAVAFAHSP